MPKDIPGGELPGSVSSQSSYAIRKQHEISVLGGNRSSRSKIESVLSEKLCAAARSKCEFIARNADCTETNWNADPAVNGAFSFHFDYQRASLTVDGPGVYDSVVPQERGIVTRTYYTSSGMGSIAAVLIALRRMGFTSLAALPGHYAETGELAALLGSTFSTSGTERAEAVLIDSAMPSRHGWTETLNKASVGVFDTSCYTASSGSIRRWLARALRAGLTVVLVRSHTKLDSLGIEYGRLGSIMVAYRNGARLGPDLTRSLNDTIRLIGVAPAPINFPPFAGRGSYRPLSRQRVAEIMRNTRLLANTLSRAGHPVKAYHHGLFVTLPLAEATTEESVRNVARGLAADLARQGFPVRHAGSFGFDFVAVEWFTDSEEQHTVLRIATGDLPREVMGEIADAFVSALQTRW